MNCGTQKLIQGKVRSGDYSSYAKVSAIGNNINDYSRDDNKITLTGIYVDSNGNEEEIKKEILIEVDWYGTVKALTYYLDRTQDYTDLPEGEGKVANLVKKVTVTISYMFKGQEQRVELSTILSKER